MSMSMKAREWNDFELWLEGVKKAWETKDPNAVADLCSESGFEYFENPFDPPLTTKKAVKKLWGERFPDQEDINFVYQLLLTTPEDGYARWRVRFKSKKAERVIEMDGIFIIELDDRGLCTKLRQWWIEKKE